MHVQEERIYSLNIGKEELFKQVSALMKRPLGISYRVIGAPECTGLKTTC